MSSVVATRPEPRIPRAGLREFEVGLRASAIREREVVRSHASYITSCAFAVASSPRCPAIAARNGKLPWPYIDPEKALPWIEQKTGLSLAESQVATIRLALLSKVLVITGGPYTFIIQS
jgi:hypothetical protein